MPLSPIQKVIGVSALVVAGGGLGGYIATQSDEPPVAAQSANRYCATLQGECRMMREMMGEKQCPTGWFEVPSCTEYGTVEIPTPEPTPDATPIPTPEPTSTPRPPTPTPTPQPMASCDPVRIIRWANVTPDPVGVTLMAQAGSQGGELWTPAGKRALLPREFVQITAAGGIAVGAGLVDLRGSAVQVVDGREVPVALPIELVWPCWMTVVPTSQP